MPSFDDFVRAREELDRANTERQTLAAELATMTEVAQGNRRHAATLTTTLDAIEKILQHPDASLRERLQQIEDTLKGAVAAGLGSSRRAQDGDRAQGQAGPAKGEFCHRHFSWLCQAGQGKCQKECDNITAIMVQDKTDAEDAAPFCRRCGHACAHTPKHELVETPDGPVCKDGAWCVQLQHADEAARAVSATDAQDPAPTTAASPLVVAAVARALREHAGRRADEIRHLAETLDGAELGAALGDLMADHWDELATEALAAARLHMAAGATFLDRR